MQIILILLAIGIVIWMLKGIINLFKTLLKIALVIAGIAIYIIFWQVTIPLTVFALILLAIRFVYGKIKAHLAFKRRQKANRIWLKEHNECYAIQDIDKTFRDLMISVYDVDRNSLEYKFDYTHLPYGRINAFLSHFNKNIDIVEPYYYSCIPSKNNSEVREYGMVIARDGIYVSQENRGGGQKAAAINEFLPFTGLKSVEIKENKISAIIISKNNCDDCIQTLSVPSDCIEINVVRMICQGVINNKISASYYCNNLVDLTDHVNVAEQNVVKRKNAKNTNRVVEAVGSGGALENNAKTYNELKGYLGGNQGGGYGAEYANGTLDKLFAHITENTAQKNLDALNRQMKNGADRTVDGRLIQTKYYKTARESIAAAFESGEARYIDNKGRMMQIEVPRDQYVKALEEMQKYIDNGKVPGYRSGERAEDYVRKGYVTYEQAWNVARAGTIESLGVDIACGVVNSLSPAGISATIVFAGAVLNGESLEDAAHKSMSVGMRVYGKGTFAYVLTNQLSRKEIAIPYTTKYLRHGIPQGNEGITNPIFEMSEKMAEKIRKSDIAQSSLGRGLQADSVNGRALIQYGVTAICYFGPDVYDMLSGKISGGQLVKNSAVTVGGIAGAHFGEALIPIPVVGGLIGGAIGGFAAKCVMDEFVEDDQIKMFRILKEEFIDAVSMAGLTKEEVNQVANDTIAHPELEKILQNMFASGEYRKYARVAIMDEAIVLVMKQRRKITMREYRNGVEAYLTKIA